MEQEKDPGLYRITSHAEPVFEFGRWRTANIGGYQIYLYDHDVRLLLGEEFELEPGEVIPLAISKWDFYAAMAQKMTDLDAQIFSLSTMVSDALDMLRDVFEAPEKRLNLTARLKKLKELFRMALAAGYTPKEADTLFPKEVKEMREEDINPYDGEVEKPK